MGGASLIGLISDTHGILRAEAITALQGSDLIIHAGDIGGSEILNQLSAIAPVVAVRGNVDKAPWASELQTTEVIEPASIYVIHDINGLGLNPSAAEIDVIVSGHSHRPGKNIQSGVLYINPGSVGPRRFKLPVTIARLNLSRNPWGVDFVDLLESGIPIA